MSTFSKLSLVAQYDDMCRLVNKLIKESAEEEDSCIAMLENLQKRWDNRERVHEGEKEELRDQLHKLDKENKKLNRHLEESRRALVRESNEKKNVEREKKNLINQIRQVRQLLETENNGDTAAHRKRVIKCLDVERLSSIQSDDSDDCVSVDYDRTDDDILGTGAGRNSLSAPPAQAQPQRRSNSFDEALESLHPNEQPTLLYRFLDKDKNSDNGSLQASSNSTSNLSEQKKSATLMTRSTATLMRPISRVNTPVSNPLKPHKFVTKKIIIRAENCVPCGGKVGFYSDCVKCENCGVTSHPDCKEKCPLPCVKITAPNTRSSQKKVLISNYVNSDAVPKVPALIVHCCNEIERDDNIKKPYLYRSVAHQKDVEELMQKILKSKSGMPNLSKCGVDLLTGVVKTFLQNLDESLITTTLWSHFAEAIKMETPLADAKIHMSCNISHYLPPANRDTLAFLMQHLHVIARHSHHNEMTKENLAKALAPTIVGSSRRQTIPQNQVLNETQTQIKIMEILFEIEEDFWASFVPRMVQQQQGVHQASSLGTRLLNETPGGHKGPRTRSSRIGSTLQTPKLKPLFS